MVITTKLRALGWVYNALETGSSKRVLGWVTRRVQTCSAAHFRRSSVANASNKHAARSLALVSPLSV